MFGIPTFILSVIIGYLGFLYLSHPKKKKHKVPKLRVGCLELMPNIRIHAGKKIYHFHHWLVLTIIIAVPVIIHDRFQYPLIFQGLLVGGIIQGLRYSDRFHFRYPKELELFTEQITEQFNEQIITLNEKLNETFKEKGKKLHKEPVNNT